MTDTDMPDQLDSPESESSKPSPQSYGPWSAFTQSDYALAMLGALLALAVYLKTVAVTVTGEDSGELIAAAATLGIPHPTGYPLWCLFGFAFTKLIPIGDAAFRVNCMSAFFGAATVFLVILIVIRLTRSHLAGLGGGLALAFSREFWEQSVIAEVYTLNAFFFAWCILLILVWRETRRDRVLRWFAFIYGLSLTNHSTMALVGPVFGLYVLAIDPRIWRRVGLLSHWPVSPCWLLGQLYLPSARWQTAMTGDSRYASRDSGCHAPPSNTSMFHPVSPRRSNGWRHDWWAFFWHSTGESRPFIAWLAAVGSVCRYGAERGVLLLPVCDGVSGFTLLAELRADL